MHSWVWSVINVGPGSFWSEPVIAERSGSVGRELGKWVRDSPLHYSLCCILEQDTSLLSTGSSKEDNKLSWHDWTIVALFVKHQNKQTGLDVIKLFSGSTQLSTKIILLINIKMPTIVGILTFISMINTTSERLKAWNIFICRYLSFFMSSWNFVLSWVEHEKSYITSGQELTGSTTKIPYCNCCLWRNACM